MEVRHSDKKIDASSLEEYIEQPVWDDKNKKWRIISKIFDQIFGYGHINRTVHFSDGKEISAWRKNGLWEEIPLYPILDYENKSLQKGENICQ